MKKKMISTTKLKAIIKTLPNNLLLECGKPGKLMIGKEKDESIISIGIIDFETGELSYGKCPTCAVLLGATDTNGKLRCPKCKNTFQG